MGEGNRFLFYLGREGHEFLDKRKGEDHEIFRKKMKNPPALPLLN